ncbi:MAG: peptidylprolyl isomerase [Labilithrix sp.]|nr:peptidylprolyl isomerase [Labilithrix sp.]
MRRSRLAAIAAAIACSLATSCSRSGSAPADTSADAAVVASFDDAVVARAEDARRAKDVPPEIRTSHDVAARRRSARALARIADTESVEGLLGHLADEDPETVAWAAYGLGYTCKGREDAHVRALAARAASLVDAGTRRPNDARGALELEPRSAIARAIGRCAGPLSEQVLVAFVRTASPLGRASEPGAARGAVWLDPALLGLGDLATRRKQLGADAMTALLDAAGDRTSPHDLALYALGRADPGEAYSPRVAEVARLALGRPGAARIHAIRALGRAGKESPKEIAPDLARVVVDAKGYDEGERAEAARALGALGDAGQAAIAGAIAELTPDAKDPIAIASLAGSAFNVLYTLLGQLGAEAPKKAEPSLSVLASLAPPTQPKPGFARRLAEIRCSAALALARGAYDADILRKCDAESSEASQRARLASLLRRPVTPSRLAAFRAFAKSDHLRVREDVVEALASHPEIGDAGASVIADALTSKRAGLVATAAEMLHAHPERAMVLAESEKRAALDPKSPPPTSTPAQELAPVVAKALSAAIAEKWPEDRFETRIALVEAAASVRHPQAKEIATLACSDANPVLRERAQKALRTLGAPVTACDAPERQVTAAAELGATLAKPTKIVLTTDAGELTVILEPELSPITTTRIASLARSGFYKGVVVHRVVPGFVVQLGDPDGDGFGGSGTSLRCETSPVAFNRLDVGMALAGRDTGSSQFFVTLSRTPHLDGEYARIGRAEGDWASVAQGDVITDARVIE